MMFELSGKIIVVTGSNGLLGKHLFSTIQSQGAQVIGTDISFSDQQENEILMDITDESSVISTIQSILRKYGKIDGWVNNAYPRTADWGNKLEDVSYQSWRQNIDMHLNGYFLCCNAILKQMKSQRCGSVVNMSSIYGHLAPDFSVYEGTGMTMPVAYSAIKSAINNLTRYFAAYYGPYNVRVNAVSPGGIFANQPSEFVKKYIARVPLGRMASPQDVAAMVVFLMSDEAGYITGQNMIVDGGWSIK